jgi:photosystem II stability/assembly factor-like uncharacterized protein
VLEAAMARVGRIPRFVRKARLAAIVCVVVTCAVGLAPAAAQSSQASRGGFAWEPIDIGSTFELGALDVVDDSVAWLAESGAGGEVLRTIDGGLSFDEVGPPGSRFISDVEAFGPNGALLLGMEDGGARVYRTKDGGTTWRVVLRAESGRGGFGCLAMFNHEHGFLVGDKSVEQKFQVFVTDNSGRKWKRIPWEGMPLADPAEFIFVQGGNCADATGRSGFFVTNQARSRVFRTRDMGYTWEAVDTAVPSGLSAVAFRTNRLGIASGGTFPASDVARTTDGGQTWQLVDERSDPERYGMSADWWADRRGTTGQVPPNQRVVLMVGEPGSSVSTDRGRTWSTFDDRSFVTMDCARSTTTCWAADFGGTLARLVATTSPP